MNTLNLTQAVAEKTGLSKTDARKALVATIDTITAAVCKGTKVRLVGFGTFEQVRRKARTGYNPKTRQPIKIGASKLPKFRPGRAFKDVVKKSRPGRTTEVTATFKPTAKVTTQARKAAVSTTAKKVVAKKVVAKKATTKAATRTKKPVTLVAAVKSVLGRRSKNKSTKKAVSSPTKKKTTSKFS